jgi:hypothetical protein
MPAACAQLWGFNANGALSESVQEPSEFLQKKSQNNLDAEKLSNEVTVFEGESPQNCWRSLFGVVG